MARGTVHVIYRKYDGSPHRRYPAVHLGEDEHGVWLGVPDGTVATVGSEEVVRDTGHAVLVPRAAWWTALFNPPPRPTEVYCDIVTPAVWTARDEVVMVDLDLDVRRRRETRLVELLDEDEFAEHGLLWGYPADAAGQARAAAEWLVRALSDGTEPFATEFLSWLAKVPVR